MADRRGGTAGADRLLGVGHTGKSREKWSARFRHVPPHLPASSIIRDGRGNSGHAGAVPPPHLRGNASTGHTGKRRVFISIIILPMTGAPGGQRSQASSRKSPERRAASVCSATRCWRARSAPPSPLPAAHQPNKQTRSHFSEQAKNTNNKYPANAGIKKIP